VVGEEKAVEAPDRSVKTAQDTSPLLALLGFGFWRMKGAVGWEMGVSDGTWFTLALLARKDGMNQGELSQRFEIDPSRVTCLAKRLEREGLLRREHECRSFWVCCLSNPPVLVATIVILMSMVVFVAPVMVIAVVVFVHHRVPLAP